MKWKAELLKHSDWQDLNSEFFTFSDPEEAAKIYWSSEPFIVLVEYCNRKPHLASTVRRESSNLLTTGITVRGEIVCT